MRLGFIEAKPEGDQGADGGMRLTLRKGWGDKEETPDRLMIDVTHLKAHRTAASLLKKGMFPAVSVARRAA